jgi:hypothetical protein
MRLTAVPSILANHSAGGVFLSIAEPHRAGTRGISCFIENRPTLHTLDGKQFPGPSSPRLELIFRKQDIVETELP